VSSVRQFGMDAWTAVAGVELGMDGADIHEQGIVARCCRALAGRSRQA
jgi:hypothetical protein